MKKAGETWKIPPLFGLGDLMSRAIIKGSK